MRTRQAVIDTIASNHPSYAGGGPEHTNTAIKSVGMVHSLVYEIETLEGTYQDASLILVPRGGDQIVLARGSYDGQTAIIDGLDIPCGGSIKVRASSRAGSACRIRAVLTVSGCENFEGQFEYGAAGIVAGAGGAV